MTGLPPDAEDDGRKPRRSVQLRALVALIFVEAAALAGLTVFLIFELLTERPDSYLAAIGLTVLTGGAAVWLAVIAVNTLRGMAWIRGATVTVQVLQIAVAIGSFQGLFARPEIGWLLLAPAIAVLALLFTRPVIAETRRREEY